MQNHSYFLNDIQHIIPVMRFHYFFTCTRVVYFLSCVFARKEVVSTCSSFFLMVIYFQVRKRPLNKKELTKNEEDIIETRFNSLVVHETKLKVCGNAIVFILYGQLNMHVYPFNFSLVTRMIILVIGNLKTIVIKQLPIICLMGIILLTRYLFLNAKNFCNKITRMWKSDYLT